MLHKKTTTIKKPLLICYFFAGCLIYIFSCYFPFVMEYYVNRPEEDLFTFLLMEFRSVNTYSHYEMFILFLLIMILYSLIFRFDITFIIITTVGIVLAYASHLKYSNRLEMLNFADLKLTEAAGMAMNYLEIKIDKYAIAALLFWVLIVGYSFVLHKYMSEFSKQITKRKKIIIRIFIGCICAASLFIYHTHFMNVELSKNPHTRYAYFSRHPGKHVLFQFVQKTKFNYTPEDALQCYSSLTDKLITDDTNSTDTAITDELPAVIVIMNESWWNVDNISSDYVSYSTNPMESFNNLAGLCDIGTTSVNIYGGGTISSEAEFLTGFNTKYFTTTADIYSTLDGRNFLSIVDYFNALGYSTTAIHPYYSTFYDREDIYEQMNFDTSIFEDDMKFTSIYDKYISDDSLVNQIIYEYEKNPSEPNFIFSVSIASHGRNLNYESEDVADESYAIDVCLSDKINMNDEDYDNFVHYVNGIYESNLAFAKLVDYFEKQERPVMLLMFGDHCPNMNTATLKSFGLDASDNENLTIEQILHTTPFIAYNNFSDEPFIMDGENITAISDKLIDYLGLPDTRMTLINKYVRTFLKADTRSHMLDIDGNIITSLTEEQINAIETLLMIQYDIFYGESVCENLWDPLE